MNMDNESKETASENLPCGCNDHSHEETAESIFENRKPFGERLIDNMEEGLTALKSEKSESGGLSGFSGETSKISNKIEAEFEKPPTKIEKSLTEAEIKSAFKGQKTGFYEGREVIFEGNKFKVKKVNPKDIVLRFIGKVAK